MDMVIGDVGALRRIDKSDRRARRAQRRVARKPRDDANVGGERRRIPAPPATTAEWLPDSKLQLALTSATSDAHTFRRRLLRHGAFLLDEVGRHGAGIVCAARNADDALRAADAVSAALKTSVGGAPLTDAHARQFLLFEAAEAHAQPCRIECELVYVDERVPLFFLRDAPAGEASALAAPAEFGVGAALHERLCARACAMLGIRDSYI